MWYQNSAFSCAVISLRYELVGRTYVLPTSRLMVKTLVYRLIMTSRPSGPLPGSLSLAPAFDKSQAFIALLYVLALAFSMVRSLPC